MNTKVYNDVMSGKSDNNISKYSMLISWSKEDQAYIVSVPDLPGCMADGKTPEEAIKNAEIIIQEWIECTMKEGREIPKPHLFNDIADIRINA